MIKAVTIEGFKGVGNPITIELRPITLLFGANSAGKSTLLHALLLADEVLRRGNCNPDRTTHGGDLIDLGGFSNFVHRKDLNSSVHLSFSIDLSSIPLDKEWPIPETVVNLRGSNLDAATIGDDVFDATVEMVISWDPWNMKPYLSEYRIDLDNVPFARVVRPSAEPSFCSLMVSRSHPLWTLPPGTHSGLGLLDELTQDSFSWIEEHFEKAAQVSPRELYNLLWLTGEHPLPPDEPQQEDIELLSHLNGRAVTSEEILSLGVHADILPLFSDAYMETSRDFRRLIRESIEIRDWRFHDASTDVSFRLFLYRLPEGGIGCLAGQAFNASAEYSVKTWCRNYGVIFGETRCPELTTTIPTPENLTDFNNTLQITMPYIPNFDSRCDDEPSRPVASWTLRSLLTRLVLMPGRILKTYLGEFRYLGPLRNPLDRSYRTPKNPDPTRWACGLGAWDALNTAQRQLIHDTRSWLEDPDKLNTGYKLRKRYYRTQYLSDPFIFNDETCIVDRPEQPQCEVILVNGQNLPVHPHEVGIGISQILPVIVSAMDGHDRLQAIEQPELHVHPRLQAAMGDLFIEASKRNRHTFIIETHSEHMILRLLRRIRETEKGTAPPDRQLRTDELGIYYIRHESGSTSASRIDVDVEGEFIQPWPDDFFEIDFYERFPDAR